jgi:hypothetical protein
MIVIDINKLDVYFYMLKIYLNILDMLKMSIKT